MNANEMNEKCKKKWLDTFYENYYDVSDTLASGYVVFSTTCYTGRLPPNKASEYIKSIIDAEIPTYIKEALEVLKTEGYIVNTVQKPLNINCDPAYSTIELIIKT